jgi:NADPH:quinone reductase
MRAIKITTPGKPEVLKVHDVPMPVAGRGEVLIRVAAAGINRPDVAQRKGHYPPPAGASDIPGLEVAGIVESCGAEVTMFKPGDEVCALVTGGGYAEYCVAPEGQCLPVPNGLSLEEAASIPETYFTVWSNVFDRGRFHGGEYFLVHGGTSGIGVAAIQLVKAMGGIVYATAGSEEKCRYCEELGAVRGINYKTEDFSQVIKELTKGRGVDVILDMIGGAYTQPNLDSLAEDGRLVLINVMKGDEVPVKLSQIMRRRLTVTGSTLRVRDVAFKSAIASNLKQHVWPLFEQRKIKPIIFKAFSLSAASEAHELMESSAHIGKIILVNVS